MVTHLVGREVLFFTLIIYSFITYVIADFKRSQFAQDDDGITWLTIDSTNGGTWDDLLYTYMDTIDHTSKLGFEFTESVEYSVSCQHTLIVEGENLLYLK